MKIRGREIDERRLSLWMMISGDWLMRPEHWRDLVGRKDPSVNQVRKTHLGGNHASISG